jgi:hypothetical protein
MKIRAKIFNGGNVFGFNPYYRYWLALKSKYFSKMRHQKVHNSNKNPMNSSQLKQNFTQAMALF